jgi:Thioesterase-like superfamily
VADSFYVPLGEDLWHATVHTAGPWDPGAQHGGPPSALLGRAIERCAPRDDMVVARFTCEILGPIPVGEIAVRAAVVRPGRSVELVEAVASAAGRDVARAAAWRVLRSPSESVPPHQQALGSLPPPGDWKPPARWSDGYISALEWRSEHGNFGELGPAIMWGRMRYPLVPDEEPSPLERVLIIADSGNGASSVLDLSRWYFINPEVTVHLHREAVGEWIRLDATTIVSAGAAGLATTTLSDERGPIGVGAQSLLVAPRRGA